MASLQERNGSYRVQFCHHSKLYGFTLGRVEQAKPKPRPGRSSTCLCG